MHGDKSFAYDLLVRPGRVSGRVALLLRSTERKPVAGKICENFSPHQCTTLCEVLEGDMSSLGRPSASYIFIYALGNCSV